MSSFPEGRALKEAMSSFDLAALIPEVSKAIRGARIDNIYQIKPATLLLRLHQTGRPPLYLLAEAGKRLHLTQYALKGPKTPSAFSMALRKHLRNGRVVAINQHDFERIVALKVTTGEGEFQLVFELFGEGNIILVDPQNRILQALVYRRMRDRNIWRGEAFRQPPSSGRNPLGLNRQDLEEIRDFGRLEVVRALTRFLSIGGLYAEETLLRAQVNKDTPCEALTERELDRIFDHLNRILSPIISRNMEPRITLSEEGEWIDVTPIPLKGYVHLEQKIYKNFSEALDEYYMKTGVKKGVVEATRGVGLELEKQRRILESQERSLEDYEVKIEQNRKIGDAIYAHLNELQLLCQGILEEKRGGKPWKEIVSDILKGKETGQVPAVYFQSLDQKNLVLNVSLENLTFPLTLRRSIQANAAEYYTRAKKAESKLKGVREALKKTQERIERLQRQRAERAEKVAEAPTKRRERAWYEKFRWFHSSEGFLIIGGRDATTNELLIKRHMEPQDKVFHADLPGAPFVLVKTEGRIPSEQTMKEAAQLAASYSRAWRENFSAADVYWVYPTQVSKSPPPGQYITKGAFIISGTKNYVRNVPLQVALGIKGEKENLRVVGGPPEAVVKQTNLYVKITPGDQTSGKIAKEIRQILSRRAPQNLQGEILQIPLEEIQNFIPSGKSSVKFNS